MRASDRLFPPDRSETAKAIMAGVTSAEMSASGIALAFRADDDEAICFELKGSLPVDIAARCFRELLAQIKDNAAAARDKAKRESEDDD